jgi:hypothetical protein
VTTALIILSSLNSRGLCDILSLILFPIVGVFERSQVTDADG